MSPNAISTGTQAKQDDYLVGLEQYGLQQPSAQQKLTPLDMNIPRLYGIRLVLCFPLTSGADKFQIYENLKKGLGHTVTSIPWIAEVIGPEEGQDPKAGRVQIVDSPIGYKFPRAIISIDDIPHRESLSLSSIAAGEEIRAKIVEGTAETVILMFEYAFRLEDFSGYLEDLHKVKIQLHDAGSFCEMYHHSQNRELLKDLHKLINDIRKGSIQLLEYQAKQKLKDLLLNPGDAVDHIDHPVDSFCLQGTRQNVLRDIYDWAEDTKSPTICWLPGLAGTGKSTVSRTVARDLRDRCLGGCFFFKKGAGNRAGGRTIFSIIAYQLALNFPPVRQYIIDAVQEDPSSVMRSMNEQLRILIREPLNKVQDKKFITVVLVVDTFDECDADDRRNMMALLTECPDVLKVFITSRPEFDIEAHFTLRSAYDATYMPVLDPILNGTPAEAQGKAYDSFTQIIGSLILLANPLSMASLAVLLGVEEHDVAGTVDPLRSVLDVPRDDGPIKLFHLSFRDFLLSNSAGDLKVDENSTHAKLASRCLRHLEGELRTDICDLKSLGRSRFDIDQDTINQKIPQETQYACRYWVHHVIGSGKQLQDNNEEHQFLKRFFLNWIEVLCLTGLFFESPKMLQELLKIVDVITILPFYES
ncbi:hypothetical protein HG531_003863 [Fusarium graminearum]|nr:hypothetical protein HG531_003863 [Fusarium graminearum]